MPVRRKRILFDQTQNERGRLDSTYARLGQMLSDNDFDVETYTDFMIVSKNISEFDAIVFACPSGSRLRTAEIDAIKKFVADGGGLMLLSLSGGDRGLMTNLGQLSRDFGIDFENTAVKDERNNAGIATMPIVTSITSHPVTRDVTSLLVPSSCTLRLSGNAQGIAMTSSTAEPPSAPVVAVAEYEKGRVVAVGTYEVFRGGLKHPDNVAFAINAFKWLTGEMITPKPSEVVATRTVSTGDTARTPATAVSEPTLTEIETTLRKLVNTVVELQKDISKLSKKVDNVEDGMKKLGNELYDFAEKTRSQLGLIIPARQFQSEEEQTTRELLDEITYLEREIRSVEQIREHMKQRLASGTITRDVYEEQTAKLDVKLADLRDRIDKKKALLNKSESS
ncbi:MAG: hypothetical protein QXS20_05325 [Candidatus Thorarchaeota archaeon]